MDKFKPNNGDDGEEPKEPRVKTEIDEEESEERVVAEVLEKLLRDVEAATSEPREIDGNFATVPKPRSQSVLGHRMEDIFKPQNQRMHGIPFPSPKAGPSQQQDLRDSPESPDEYESEEGEDPEEFKYRSDQQGPGPKAKYGWRFPQYRGRYQMTPPRPATASPSGAPPRKTPGFGTHQGLPARMEGMEDRDIPGPNRPREPRIDGNFATVPKPRSQSVLGHRMEDIFKAQNQRMHGIPFPSPKAGPSQQQDLRDSPESPDEYESEEGEDPEEFKYRSDQQGPGPKAKYGWRFPQYRGRYQMTPPRPATASPSGAPPRKTPGFGTHQGLPARMEPPRPATASPSGAPPRKTPGFGTHQGHPAGMEQARPPRPQRPVIVQPMGPRGNQFNLMNKYDLGRRFHTRAPFFTPRFPPMMTAMEDRDIPAPNLPRDPRSAGHPVGAPENRRNLGRWAGNSIRFGPQTRAQKIRQEVFGILDRVCERRRREEEDHTYGRPYGALLGSNCPLCQGSWHMPPPIPKVRKTERNSDAERANVGGGEEDNVGDGEEDNGENGEEDNYGGEVDPQQLLGPGEPGPSGLQTQRRATAFPGRFYTSKSPKNEYDEPKPKKG